jgi:hypothetical protein
MTTQLIDEYRRTSYEISQSIAPGWHRRRAQFEAAMTPVREWMVGELAPRAGATVLELAAGRATPASPPPGHSARPGA